MKKEKKLRIAFSSAVFERDGHKCRMCGNTKNLNAHHITDRHEMPNGGYTVWNGITLCEDNDCHYKAEIYHITNGQQFVENCHPNTLYKMIDSSYEKALEESKKL